MRYVIPGHLKSGFMGDHGFMRRCTGPLDAYRNGRVLEHIYVVDSFNQGR